MCLRFINKKGNLVEEMAKLNYFNGRYVKMDIRY